VGHRATAMGIINAGTAVGGIVAPPLIALILSFTNWRWVFVVTGVAGLTWTLWWLSSYSVSREPIATEIDSVATRPPSTSDHATRWINLLKIRESWGLMFAKFLSDAAWYFYLFWLPKYLYDARNFDVKSVGAFAWIPYAAAGIGCLAGGWFSSWLVQREFSV